MDDDVDELNESETYYTEEVNNSLIYFFGIINCLMTRLALTIL